eukprot:TRINITY_DN1411_c0_g1_i1.p1 TRINITY_DN1411_c0_g1~~TRINITY_DN1411_c0_g1_i1.p1  ORF type:complete len:1200 (+),score=233.94 TRINITY_DN1411_c0_g1_i1:62-3661(+)
MAGIPQQEGAPRRTVSWGLDEGLEWYLSTARPVPMVALYGTGDLEKKLAGLVGQCRQQYSGMAFGFRHIENGDVMPRKKERRSYDGYIPAGILKSNWCRKHQEAIFGCVMIVLDMDQAANKEIFEASAEAIMDKLKQQLKGRQTKILLILTTAAERFPYYDKPETCQSVLRKKCDLEANKNISLLHLTQGTMEGVKRILQVGTDFSMQYYKDEAKKIKKLKESAHRTLQPRHRFKIGYYFEIRGQTDLALRYYGQCYDHIRTLSPDQFSISEIKTVAEIVMFRTCLLRLLYDEGAKVGPAARIFKDHMTWYRDAERSFPKPSQRGKSSTGGDGSISSPLRRYGAPSVTSGDHVSQSSGGAGGDPVGSVAATPSAILVHHIALARQHEQFAELLRETHAVMDTEHYTASYHYHAAATAVLQRRAYVKHLANSTDRGGGSFNAPVKPVFIGQPWGGSEDSYVTKLLEHEEEVPYEEEAIVLCIKAKGCTPEAHGHTHHALSVMIAKCHVDLERWDQAKAELQGVYNFVKEHGEWPGMGDVVLKLLMECGIKNETLNDYLEAALRYVYLANTRGAVLYSDTVRWLKGECVDSLERSLTRPNSPPVVQVDMNHPFMSVMAQFEAPTVQIFAPAVIKVRLATKADFPVVVTRIDVIFHQEGLAASSSATSATPLTLSAPQVHAIPITFKDATVMKIKEILVHIEGGVLVLSRIIGPVNDLIDRLVSETANYPNYTEARFPYEGYGLKGTSFIDRPAVRVMKSEPKMVVTLHHDPPALLDEPYPIEIRVAAGEDEVVSGSVVIRGSPDYTILEAFRADEEEVVCTDESTPGGLFEGGEINIVNKRYQITGGIPAGAVWKLFVVIRFKTCGKHVLPIDTTYSSDKGVGQFEILQRADISVEIPFNMLVQVADSMKWRQGNLDTNLPNPYCTAGYSLASNTPHTEFGNSSFNLTTRAAKQHVEELTKLGVVAPLVPYSIRTKKAAVMSPMRLNQTVALTVTITCTVQQYTIEVRGMHPIPVKGMTIVSEQVFQPVELSQGEEISVTWLAVPTEVPEMKCHLVVNARRSGSTYPCIPFTIDVPPFAVVQPPIVADYVIPESACIGEVLPLVLNMHNTSLDTVRHVTCEVSDVSTEMETRFLWNGRSSWSCHIPPASTATVEYKLIPVFPGVLSLPCMSIKLEDKPVIEPHETPSIFISPQNTAFTKKG